VRIRVSHHCTHKRYARVQEKKARLNSLGRGDLIIWCVVTVILEHKWFATNLICLQAPPRPTRVPSLPTVSATYLHCASCASCQAAASCNMDCYLESVKAFCEDLLNYSGLSDEFEAGEGGIVTHARNGTRQDCGVLAGPGSVLPSAATTHCRGPVAASCDRTPNAVLPGLSACLLHSHVYGERTAVEGIP
jgi:hypothetical protein